MKSRTYCPTPVARTSDNPDKTLRLSQDLLSNGRIGFWLPATVNFSDRSIKLVKYIGMSELFSGDREVGFAMSSHTRSKANYLPRFICSSPFFRDQALVNIWINADHPLSLSMKSVNNSLPWGIIPIAQDDVVRILAHIAALDTGHELGVTRCRPKLPITKHTCPSGAS